MDFRQGSIGHQLVELEIHRSKVPVGVLGNGQTDIDAATIFVLVVSNVGGRVPLRL
jgi:hypothetical protein